MRLVIPSPEEAQSSPALIARVAGALYLCGVALVLLALALPHPAGTDEAGTLGAAAFAAVLGVTLLAAGRHVPSWAVHTSIAIASSLVCLCIYFSGIATGLYATMFIWVVLVTTFFFPGTAAGGHLAFLLLVYGVTLSAVETPGFSPVTRWVLTAVSLAVAWATTSWLVHGLRTGAIRQGELRADAEVLARTDELTNLPNRRWLQDELTREIARAGRHGFAVWAAMIDLDWFKAFNDRHGHTAGDALLREAAGEWRSALRVSDFLARYGGEEFVVVLPAADTEGAKLVVERLRAATPHDQTCSAGLARWDGRERPDALIHRADQALYRAKEAGRDRVVLHDADGALSIAR